MLLGETATLCGAGLLVDETAAVTEGTDQTVRAPTAMTKSAREHVLITVDSRFLERVPRQHFAPGMYHSSFFALSDLFRLF